MNYDELIDSLRFMAKQGKRYGMAVITMGEAADWKAEAESVTLLLKEMPRWISVKERLPEERTWVLCQCRAKIREVLRWQDGGWYHDPQHRYMSGFVTHWMPLPTPPASDPCDGCLHSPPSSADGKPCTVCDMDNPLMNCRDEKEDEA